jgi:hypothetical protein
VNEGMPTSSPFNFPEADEVTTLEVTVAVLELPESCVGISCMKDVAFFVKAIHVKLSHKR